MTIRAAVVGCGDVSTIHLDALRELADVELVAVCDTDPARRDTAAAENGVPGVASLTETLERYRPDVVHLTTPHHQHVEPALEALAAGVDVLTEKPLASTLADADRLVAAAESIGPGGPRIGVCFQNRYNATVQEMRRILESGELGEATGAVATVAWHRTPEYYRSRPWRGTWAESGGGLLINQAIHTIDLVQWLLGGVTAVTGHASTDALAEVIEVEDTATLTLQHEPSRQGVERRSVLLATNAAPTNLPVRIDVLAERGSLQLAGELTVHPDDGPTRVVTERRPPAAARSYWGASHAALIADFYAGHGSGESFWISPAEALPSLQILKAAYDGPGGFAGRPGAEHDLANPFLAAVSSPAPASAAHFSG